jgi:nucleoside-diphosphate-sugar epimerase
MAMSRKTAPAPPDLSPSRYIARTRMATGEEISKPIDPDELLVHAHRDKHPLEIATQFLAGRLLRLTGNEERVRAGMKSANTLGARMGEALGIATGSRSVGSLAKKLIGVVEKKVYFRFREPTHLSEKEVRARVARLQNESRAALAAHGGRPRFRVLLTGATGFLGKEILFQAASDARIEQVIAVVRSETIRDPKTKVVVRVLHPRERGALLLRRLGIAGTTARKFRFVAGDIEKAGLGLATAEVRRLRKSITHVVHCAASVSFDDTYDKSYRANVMGSLNALAFSLGVQRAAGSRLVAHVAIETSYIHGRKKRSIAQESALAFPRHFYNNFYELTKAMASIETDRFMVERGLRVAQLLPSIVIGNCRTGNNRGDTKVVNAPINAFGRSKEAAERLGGGPKAWMIAAVANGFPGDPSAELNLVPVDRVAAGILAALGAPAAVGVRIHLATDNRIRSEDMLSIAREELGVKVRLADPTLFRNFTLPVVMATLRRMNEPKLAGAIEKLGTIFGGYGEWGQPIHEVGNDVRILGLPMKRPNTRQAFRMLCRHNRYVQEYGKVKDPDEIARREALWEKAIDSVEYRTGRQASSMSAVEFRLEMGAELDLRTFEPRREPRRRRKR